MKRARIPSLPMLKTVSSFSHERGAKEVDHPEEDDGRRSDHIVPCRAHRLGQVADAVGGQRRCVDRHDRDVAQHQQHVQCRRNEAGAEGGAQEADGSARAGIPQGQTDVRVGGDERDRAADEEGDGRAAPGALDRQAEGREEAAADDAADADRQRAQHPDRALRLGSVGHQSCS